ncbi:MAG TPA: hypothetical protein VFG47_03635, partial [Geminicoccaceae bacterium]|nr:hypothetical protein [Geminicoccaceae bacterium]
TPVQQRMVRSGRWNLNYYQGHRPQLFDLEADPHEARDLAEDPAHATVRDALAGWDPDGIARRMARGRADREPLRDWARAVAPPDTCRWTVRPEDNRLARRAAEHRP